MICKNCGRDCVKELGITCKEAFKRSEDLHKGKYLTHEEAMKLIDMIKRA